MEIATEVFYLVTGPRYANICLDGDISPASVTECIQHSSYFAFRGCKVYTNLLNKSRFIPVRLDGVILNEDLFNKFLEILIKGG